MQVSSIATNHRYSQNLTVTFHSANTAEGEGCSFSNPSTSLLFTTSSIPITYQCFNLDSLFSTRNTSQTTGSRNESIAGSRDPVESITWTTEQADAYLPHRNYSQVTYSSRNISEPEEGAEGSWLFEVFNGRDCHATNDTAEGESLAPWIGWTCQSAEGGECTTVPFSVASFHVGGASVINARDGKCWNAAYLGAAPGRSAGVSSAVVAAMLVTVGSMLF